MLKSINLKSFLVKNNTYIIFFAMLIACICISETFLLPINLINIGLQQSAPLLVAVGMLFVIMTGGIDLSVGSIMAISSSVACLLMRDAGFGLAGGILAAVCIGLICGMITGALVAYCNMQAFVASLSVMTAVRGVAYIITNGSPIKVEGAILSTLVAPENGYPVIIIAALVIVVFCLIQNYTTYGRIVIAVGSNKNAVELAGIRVKRYMLSTYMICGVLAAIAGIFYSARTSTGSATVGDGAELDAIAACVLGGASLTGGRGSVFKTLLGALILAFIGNIMNLKGVGAYAQDVVQGCLIVAAVLLQGIKSK